jgi:hypothetical protein
LAAFLGFFSSRKVRHFFFHLFFYDFYLPEICPQEKKEWREVIEKRLLMPTFADEDTLLFPEDPLGRHGPR